MTGPDELTTADGRDQAIRDRAAAFMASAGWDWFDHAEHLADEMGAES